VCGALLGALMTIGMVYADAKMEIPSTSTRYEETILHANRLCDRFKKEFGSLRCRDIQKVIFGRHWDLRDPDQKAEFSVTRRSELHDKCGDFVVKKAARLAAEEIID
jgi:hypothetical protein